jgi:arylsulfatase
VSLQRLRQGKAAEKRDEIPAAKMIVQQQVGQAAQSFIDFPPMQGGASFNMAAIKEQIEKAIAARSVGK